MNLATILLLFSTKPTHIWLVCPISGCPMGNKNPYKQPFLVKSPLYYKMKLMQKILPYYSLLSPIFIIGCTLAFFAGVPKGIENHPVVRHLLKNPETSALLVVKNGKVIIEQNADQPLPLASISKIVLVMVYAEEANKGTINPEERVDLKELERFYLDDGNYQTWKMTGLKEGWIEKEQVAFKYIAQGAIRFSVSTNADFLMERLGLATINGWLDQQKLTTHEPIFPFNASGAVCHNIHQLPRRDFLARMDTLSTEAYVEEVLSVQRRLALAEEELLPANIRQQKIDDRTFLKIWSDRFTKAAARDYAKLLQTLSDKENSNEKYQQHISFLFEDWAFAENPGLDQQLRHIGYKGGSTGFLLNSTLYLEDQAGHQVQVVLFMDKLSAKRHKMLSKIFSNFVFELAISDGFAYAVERALAADSH